MIFSHNFTRILLAGGLVLPLAQFAVGQQPRAGFGQAPQAPQAGVRQGTDPRGGSDAKRGVQGRDLGNQILRGSQIIGATVNLRGGSRFGTVSDFVLADSGCVEYVIATLWESVRSHSVGRGDVGARPARADGRHRSGPDS